jgi:hypothetical protein
LEQYRELNVTGISLRDLADNVNSDYREGDDLIDRQQARITLEEQIKRIQVQAGSVMVSGGNAFTLPYANHIVNAPMTDSGFNLTDETVPFYQMVLHGYFDYSGNPVNLSDEQDHRISLLRALETGSVPYYSWIYKDASLLKDTKFDYLYSTHYTDWLSEAAAMYAEANKVLKNVRGEPIVSHRKWADGVYETKFANGKRIVVNYNERSVQMNGITVQGLSYWNGGE